MGSMYRSEEMCIAQLYFQSEAAYACVSELGELGLVQFRDLNPETSAFQRKFVNEVRRCDEMERKLRYLEKEIKKAKIPILDTEEDPEAPPPREMIDLEATFEKLELEIKEVNSNHDALKKNFFELTELKHILEQTRGFFEEADLHNITDETRLVPDEETGTVSSLPMRFRFVAGVINRDRIPSFERMLWRACHGNVFLRQAEITTPLEDLVSGNEVLKSVFIIFFQGDQLKARVKKICEGFRATVYPCPEVQSERVEMTTGVILRIEDLQTVLSQTVDHRHRVLASAARNIKTWFIKVGKIKAIYHTLNMFNLDVTHKCLIAECWCPLAELDPIQMALRRGTERSGSSVPSILNRMSTSEEPPTFNRTNKLTGAFQTMVNSYGVSNYREVNPALFSIITFPFLFAVMFGDAGHGLLMFLFALWMVLAEKKLEGKYDNEMWTMVFGGRYVILLMGLFSIYTGIIYNDIFSKSMNIFGSSWTADNSTYDLFDLGPKDSIDLDPNSSYSQPPYPLGIDPIWQLSKNKLNFLNSYKMKMSILLGVAQMTFGLCLQLANLIYFKKYVEVFCDFIPQMLFLMSIFGYLCALIIVKMFLCTVPNGSDPDACGSGNAPSLLITLINMFLFKKPPGILYPGQSEVQTALVILAVLCIPWMLLVKPLILYQRHYKCCPACPVINLNKCCCKCCFVYPGKKLDDICLPSVNRGRVDDDESVSVIISSDQFSQSIEDEEDQKFHPPRDSEPWDFANLIILQCIHVIEFCLGTISNTASYLRLWALSLAHAELTEVLWTMIMVNGLKMNQNFLGSIVLFGAFVSWAELTIFILLLMEGLSAFLHALRLHWVEFQNKFYGGEGHIFTPFSFKYTLESEEDL